MLDDDDQEIFQTDGAEAFLAESWNEPEGQTIRSLWEWPEPEETQLKIAICGAGGTGKKSLANALGDKLGIPTIQGVVRKCHILGHKINKSATIQDEIAIFFAYLWTVLEYEEFVSAGSLIDVLAYMHYVVERTGDKHVKLLQRAINNCSHLLANSSYSVFLYLPIEKKPSPDGIRSVDMKFQQAIDANIKYYLNAFDIDYLPISGSKKDKLLTAYRYLDEFGLLVDRGL